MTALMVGISKPFPMICLRERSGGIAPASAENDAAPAESEADMSERLETLQKARERMVEDRDVFAKTLAAPFDRDKAERARLKFIETQLLIDAIDRAIAGERTVPGAV
jgi:hypothetical protein